MSSLKYCGCWISWTLKVITAILYCWIHCLIGNQCTALRSCWNELRYGELYTTRTSEFWTYCKMLAFLLVVPYSTALHVVVESSLEETIEQARMVAVSLSIKERIWCRLRMVIARLHNVSHEFVKTRQVGACSCLITLAAKRISSTIQSRCRSVQSANKTRTKLSVWVDPF